MKLSGKDKSLILFLASALIVLWVIFSIFSKLFFTAAFQVSDIKKITSKENPKWFNLSEPLKTSDLKNRVILVDFWSYSCLSCIKNLPQLKKLQDELASKLLVVSVHSGKLKNERDLTSIKKAILKYNIESPVIDDSDLSIYKAFDIKSLPSFVLINPRGNIEKTYSNKKSFKSLKKDVKKLISKYRFGINRESLPILLEKNSIIANILSFPTKLEYAQEFSYKIDKSPAIFIANTGANNIVAANLAGDMIVQVGSKDEGFEDGDLESSSFRFPTGVLYDDNNKLYVADTGNHAIRLVDFAKNEVSTIIGSGKNGDIIAKGNFDIGDVDLSSPTDMEFFPDKNHIVIANSGSNQILSYNIKESKVSVIAGDGSLGMKDGKYPNNSLAQTSDISVYGDKLYFLDSKTSALRVFEKSKGVETIIGGGLQDFGHKNGDKSLALMQNPLGLMVDDTGIYISDSFNHKIRKYDFSSKKLRDLAGLKSRGDSLGKKSAFDEPVGIINVVDRFYIADSNNNRIVILKRGSLSSKLLNVMPPLKLVKERLAEYLPNLKEIEGVELQANKKITLNIKFKKGWKINKAGPSFVNLLEIIDEKNANLISNYDWSALLEKKVKLPEMKVGNNYMLQGVIYYCEDKDNALCYVKSYEQKISVSANNESTKINLLVGKDGLVMEDKKKKE